MIIQREKTVTKAALQWKYSLHWGEILISQNKCVTAWPFSPQSMAFVQRRKRCFTSAPLEASIRVPLRKYHPRPTSSQWNWCLWIQQSSGSFSKLRYHLVFWPATHVPPLATHSWESSQCFHSTVTGIFPTPQINWGRIESENLKSRW